ncbi:3-oxoacyl-[acyl-carrier-protein] reductase [Pelotomaculum terephthalicicum JT]|uniref:3-oxoacyl-[acyl-carrier-protein] reductase n=1 Tax=Pelotomaculum TaxID=191373 RepID=UPI0009CD06BE|nr:MULTISPECIES: 3-oxoacyl-[acyl-carrier-protein] reductase [Pelotomaculum]MCG9969768.1 3-oxoacyl-[acyl-carrier-protein] reductase [Pelotomaculum terephthalicicum JT]OPX89929.1 MAG: 3-oxoacyl-(acyl-carrier-protein) reductase FabG [Pelotomaculum sp. PtaB.Bin117]OPY62165.1 MAG: 3-oxoacyl-(acyl-carrier-protein) reductase FabG [Pelotomaculum sp. PtaU1.Bin065]
MVLNGRTAIVTGASRGIGRAIALNLAKKGAAVLINYAGRADAAAEVAEAISSAGGRALVCQADVSNQTEVEAMVKTALAEFGKVDILVNNAGITRDNVVFRMKDAEWDAVLGANLKGAFNCIKIAAKSMFKNHYGRIINISSVVGLTGNSGQANYSAAKAGLIGLTRAMAKELGSRNITVNAIAPGYIDTEMTKGLAESVQGKMLEQIPLKRFGCPEEVAELAAFLASDAAGYITGQTINVDGGMVCM